MIYGYVRVSTVEQADGGSLEEQRRKVAGVALLRGEPVACIFEDAGVSGARALDRRPAGQALLAVLRPGDVVVVSKLDRFSRSALDALEQAERFRALGVALVVTDLGVEPVTSNGVAKLFFTILAGVAEFERSRIRERQMEGQRAKRGAGGHIGGTAPFGYRVIGRGKAAWLAEIPEDQEALAMARRMRRAGFSYRVISEEIHLLYGRRVSHVALRRALARDERERVAAEGEGRGAGSA